MDWQGFEVAICLVGRLIDYLTYGACLAVCERIFLHIWPVEMARQSMVGLEVGSMDKGGMDIIQNVMIDFIVVFLYIGNRQQHMILLHVVDDAIVICVA